MVIIWTFIWSGQTVNATVVPVGSGSVSFSETTVATLPSGYHDIVMNCDMLTDLSGMIKGIVWGQGNLGGFGSTSSPPPPAKLFAEDYSGNTTTYTLPTDAEQPDMVLSNWNPSQTNSAPIRYQAVVVYVIGEYLYLDIYEIDNIGYAPGFGIIPVRHILLSTDCDGMPHIDMWEHNGPLLSGYGSMHQFAVVWAEGNTNKLMAAFGDATTLSLSTTATPTIKTIINSSANCITPDVACFIDINTGLYKAEIAYGAGTSSTGHTTGLKLVEC